MRNNSKQISNPFSTGGGGGHFEAHVQASYVVLMLTGGYAPSLPCWPIKEIKLQGKIDGFDTDDVIVFVENPSTKERRKLLGQLKHSVKITPNDKIFGEVIQAAWNDFNDVSIFNKNKDVIALITSALSSTDTEEVNWILDQARWAKSADEFFRKVEQAYFSSKLKRKKLSAFQIQLKKANNNIEVSKDVLFTFLQHFHLIGYDLGREVGIVLSLLHSHISQFNSDSPQWVWSRIVDFVQTSNQSAGTIILEKIPEDLRNAFKQRVYITIPDEFSSDLLSSENPNWALNLHASDLMIACLIGSWDENNSADIEAISQLINEEYDSWIPKTRNILQHPQSPLSLKNGSWRINDRESLWQTLGAQIFDDSLECFEKISIDVLTERDPKFRLPVEERFTAVLHGNKFRYSSELRRGVAEGVALLGSKHEALINCSQDKPETIATLVVRGVLENADWVLWSSLNSLLPLLAEAAPNGFLNAVDHALEYSPSPFNEIFSQESIGITGENYLTGLLWALEILAWDEQLFIRACVLLGELAAHDSGSGNWANRPSNSLTTILLPWLPQTTAPVEKRKVALKILQEENPDVAWKLLLTLLPDQHQTSFGTHKPSWRNFIPKDWHKGVTNQEYWEQINSYAELAVSMADHDIVKLNELVDYLHKLPRPSLDNFLDRLSSEAVIGKQEDERLPLWNNLQNFITKHKRFSEAKWALSSDIILNIEQVTEQLAPVSPSLLYHRLFSNRDFDVYEDNGNWEEQRIKLEERRQQAIKEILAYNKADAVIQFSTSVEAPYLVGYAFGAVAQAESDSAILPSLLGSQNSKISQFMSGYIGKRQHERGWTWVDNLDKSGWSVSHVTEFLSCLPFMKETWERATAWLEENDSEYWKTAGVNPYQTDGSLSYAVDRLIACERPNAAVQCIYRMLRDNQPLDKSQVVKALLASTTSKEPSNVMDTFSIAEIIKALQQAPDTDPKDVCRVEWAFLPLLEQNNEISPKFLEHRLASEPEFFSEVISLIYRSKKEGTSASESKEERKSVAFNAWKLLDNWQTPPGLQINGTFSDESFLLWLNKVKELCTQSGHIDIAMTHVGQVLIHCPPDPQGLWINRTVAGTLNARDATEMRAGFSLELFNSRGVHWVDPTGAPERKLAEQYRQKAEEVENAGCHRFAVTLRNLAQSYDRDANQIVAEHDELYKYN